MSKIQSYSIFISLFLITFSCGEKKTKNEIKGNWSAKYIVSGKTELLGYFDNKMTYSLKPTIFTENGKMLVFLQNEKKDNIEAEYSILSNDSIEIKSDIDLISGIYGFEIKKDLGKRIMLFKGLNKKMYFEQISGQIEL